MPACKPCGLSFDHTIDYLQHVEVCTKLLPGASQSATMLLRTLRQHPEAKRRRAPRDKGAQPKLL